MLDLTQVLTYSAALGIAAAIPGPGMAAWWPEVSVAVH
jgi:threonine/homoserine/homoserine lactone efflux protein